MLIVKYSLYKTTNVYKTKQNLTLLKFLIRLFLLLYIFAYVKV